VDWIQRFCGDVSLFFHAVDTCCHSCINHHPPPCESSPDGAVRPFRLTLSPVFFCSPLPLRKSPTSSPSVREPEACPADSPLERASLCVLLALQPPPPRARLFKISATDTAGRRRHLFFFSLSSDVRSPSSLSLFDGPNDALRFCTVPASPSSILRGDRCPRPVYAELVAACHASMPRGVLEILPRTFVSSS